MVSFTQLPVQVFAAITVMAYRPSKHSLNRPARSPLDLMAASTLRIGAITLSVVLPLMAQFRPWLAPVVPVSQGMGGQRSMPKSVLSKVWRWVPMGASIWQRQFITKSAWWERMASSPLWRAAACLAAVGGAVGGLAGLGLGSVLGGVGGRLGSSMAGRVAMGFVEGGLSDVASRIAMNAVMGCRWNEGLWSAFIGGGLGGGVGAAIGGVWRGFKNLSRNARKSILLNDVYEAMDALMPPEITTFTNEMIDKFMKSPEWLEWQRRLLPKYNTPDNILTLPRTVLSGHGGWHEADGYITVPEGTYLITYSPLGGTISDAMGNLIELDQVHDELYRQIFSPGDIVPNYTLFPPDKLNIMGGSIYD